MKLLKTHRSFLTSFIALMLMLVLSIGYFVLRNASRAFRNQANSLSVISTLKSNTGWTLFGPSDGRVNGVVLLPRGAMLAATNSGGVFLTNDNGKHWIPYSIGLNSHHINHIKSINGDVYVATDDGVYKLMGAKWTNLYTTSTSLGKIVSLANDGITIFAMAEYGLIERQQDGSWISLSLPSSANWLFTLFVSTNKTIYIGAFDGLYESTNDGQTWKHTFSTSGVFGISEGSNEAIYIADSYGQLYKKTGSEFAVLPNAPKISTGAIFYQNDILFVAGVDRLYQSIDNGNSFTLLVQSSNDKNGFWDIRHFFIPDKNSVIFSHDNGISRYFFSTQQLLQYESIPNYTEITSLGIDSNKNLLTTYWDHGHGKYKNNNSSTWMDIFIGGELDYFFATQKDTDLYLDRNYDELLMFDAGGTILWKKDISINNPKFSVDFGLKNRPIRVFALYNDSSNRSIIKSFNLTANIDQELNEKDIMLPFNYANALTVDSQNQSHILVIAESKVYETINGGNSWDDGIVTEYNHTQLACSEVHVNPFYQTDYLLSCINLVLRVKNKQISYVALPTLENINDHYTIAYDNDHQGIIYAGSVNGFFYTMDDGNTWQSFNRGLYTSDVRVIKPAPDKIYIGTWGSGNAVINKSVLLNSKN